MNKNKKQDQFMQGILALMFSQVLIKVLGLLYSVYLTNKNGFGDTGNAIYMSGYQIYALLLSISSIGIPNAISKLVSEKIALKDFRSADRIFKIAIFVFSVIGFGCTIILFYGAEIIANSFLQIPEAEYTLKALAPAIFFVSISSVIRGYCNGRNQIDITAKSQTIEQALKSILTISLVEIIGVLSDSNTKLMAAVANFATTMATIISFVYIFNINQNKRRKIVLSERVFQKEKIHIIVKKIFKVSIPMSISSLLSSVNKNIDSITVVRCLKKNLGEHVAKARYGILSTKIDLLVAMPLSFNIAFATALVPEIASSLVKNDFENINRKLKFSLLVTILIGLPCTLGMFVYAKEILNLLFPNANAGTELLRFASITIIFAALTQTINGALQGLGKNKVPAIGLFCGMIVKLIANLILIPMQGIYEMGAVIGNILCHFISFIISYKALKNTFKLDFKIHELVIKPIIINGIMIVFSYGMYIYMKKLGIYEYISTIIGIITAICSYIVLIVVLKIFSEEEIFMLPNGEKIYIFLKKIKKYDFLKPLKMLGYRKEKREKY